MVRRDKHTVSVTVNVAENGYVIRAGEDFARGAPGQVYVARSPEERDDIVTELLGGLE